MDPFPRAPARSRTDALDELYATDLVYRAGCHTLCGDAHCCSFARHKSRFAILGRKHFQELPLLAGEFEYLEGRGLLAQFGEFERKHFELALPDGRTIHADSIVSTRTGCACDHDTRPVICRLYPLLPVFELDGRLAGVERLTIYDELERIAGQPQSCAIDAIPLDQLDLFARFCRTLASRPEWLFQLAAYRLIKDHAAAGIATAVARDGKDAFAAFEWGFLRRRLVDTTIVGPQLATLATRHHEQFGEGFVLP